uniref:C2 domain-containing protein n=1 Tax=Kalanchoe fedtschenkoi TaxID=63787 RepID=A0A7N0VJM0_KALFE
MPIHANPFHLLEITVISAQDLSAAAKNMKTYSVAWVNPDRKLTTRIDNDGHTNPNWNDKFIFRVDDAFLECETSAVMIEIYAIGWMKDFKIGTVRFLINNLEFLGSEIRFVALQIRRPSGRPQGILNVGATLLDSTMRSMPLCSELGSSAVGSNNPTDDNKSELKTDSLLSPKLQRSKSERSTSTVSDGLRLNNRPKPKPKPKLANNTAYNPNGSYLNGSYCNGSTITGSEVGAPKGSIISDVGPSPSVVAAAIARGIYPLGMKVVEATGSSILQEWKEKTKIARWKTELPPVFDHVGTNNTHRKGQGRKQHRRRHTDGGGGLFSCIGSAYGCEFKIVCGSSGDKAEKKKARRRRNGSGGGGRVHVSPPSDSELS